MREKGLLFVFSTALISGVSIFVNKFGVAETNPYLFTWLKNTVVSIFLLATLLISFELKTLKLLNRGQWTKLLAIAFFGGSVPFLLFFGGLKITSAATASFIHKTMFLYVAAMAAIFLREHLGKRMVLAGALLLLGNALLLSLTWKGFNIGDVMILLATLFWAVETVISKHTLQEVPPRIVAFGRMFFGSLFILVFLAVNGDLGGLGELTTAQLQWVAVTSILLLGYVVTWYSGLRWTEASVAACILLLGSAVTTTLSIVFLGSSLTLQQAIGLLLLVLGVVAAVGAYSIRGLFAYIARGALTALSPQREG